MATAKKTTTKTTAKAATTPKSTKTAQTSETTALNKELAALKKEVATLKKTIAEMKLSAGSTDSQLRDALTTWAERVPGPGLRKFLKRSGITKG